METDRSNLCGCKGIRTCLKCEAEFGINKNYITINELKTCYSYCLHCNALSAGLEIDHSKHKEVGLPFPGVYIQLDFISCEEEERLMDAIDSIPWDLSQSGRRKQNFGPKCNFKKRKLQLGSFKGFPESTQFIQDRFKAIELLKDYQTIEQCSLEYDPTRGASIDPHIDDCWIWGERIVTVNLMSDSILTLTQYHGDTKRYNLEFIDEKYLNKFTEESCDITVRIPMPRRSLLVLYGQARYCWEHMVLREDIRERRVCLAYREFTPPYLQGGKFIEKSQPVLDQAKIFF